MAKKKNENGKQATKQNKTKHGHIQIKQPTMRKLLLLGYDLFVIDTSPLNIDNNYYKWRSDIGIVWLSLPIMSIYVFNYGVHLNISNGAHIFGFDALCYLRLAHRRLSATGRRPQAIAVAAPIIPNLLFLITICT